MKVIEDPLVTVEFDRHDWDNLRDISGTGTRVGDALLELIAADSPDSAERAYWSIENRAVVQGQLYESAVALTRVTIAALVDAERPSFVRGRLLELLFQLVAGEADESEVHLGRGDLGSLCREAASEGLWLLYRDLLSPQTQEAAHWVLNKIDPVAGRLLAVEKLLAK
jgi:hypothetical protein